MVQHIQSIVGIRRETPFRVLQRISLNVLVHELVVNPDQLEPSAPDIAQLCVDVLGSEPRVFPEGFCRESSGITWGLILKIPPKIEPGNKV